MPEDPSRTTSSRGEGLVAIGFGALAIACCAGLPLIAGFAAGGVAAGTLLGAGAGVLGAIVLVGVVVLKVRARRRACAPGATPRAATVPKRR